MILTLTLFGSFSATNANSGQLYTFSSKKTAALLAYLTLESDKPHSRTFLANLLWSEVTDEKALLNLRQTLYRLRRDLKEMAGEEVSDCLVSSRHTVQWRRDDDVWACDALLFSDLLTAVSQHPHNDIHTCLACQTKLARAISLYQADLLDGFHTKNALFFEKWLLSTQEQYHQQAVTSLQALLIGHFKRGEYAQTISFARWHTQMEPWQEIGWRYLMLALFAQGDRQSALAEYEVCRQQFLDELGTSPSAELEQLHTEIQADKAMTPLNASMPYKGLHTFGETDATYFFGREEMVSQLADKLAHFGFAAVVAPSGGGKSSVVQAGLLPRLRRDGWRISMMRPGERPLHHLHDAIADTADKRPHLLLVDQFEELYVNSIQPDERQQFLDELLQPQQSLSIVITLRADFIGNAISHRPLADALQQGTLLLGPMNQAELERAIAEPARLHGVTFENGLIERLLHDVGTDTGHLPLLEFTLLQLWNKREGRRLTHIAYESIGRLDGALANYADGIYEALTAIEQKTAQTIFLQLVQPDQHVDDMRRPLHQQNVSVEQWQIAQKLANTRLLVIGTDENGRGIAELAHEILIRYWYRFQSWLGENQMYHSWLSGLLPLILKWQNSGNDNGVLLRGAPLVEAGRWATERADDLPVSVSDFIASSFQLKQEQEEKEKRQQQRERSQRLALSAQLALFNNDPAKSLELAFEANQMDDPPIIAQRILSEAAYAPGTRRRFREHTGPVLDMALHPDKTHFLSASVDGTIRLSSITDVEASAVVARHKTAVCGVAFAPDGKTAVSINITGKWQWWSVETSDILAHGGGHADGVYRIAFLRDSSGFLTAGADGIVRLWSLPDGALAHEFKGHQQAIRSLAVSPDGRLAASGGEDHHLFIWDIASKTMAKQLKGVPNTSLFSPEDPRHFSILFGAVFMPDSRRLLAADSFGYIFIWDVETGTVLDYYNSFTVLRRIDVTADGSKAIISTLNRQIVLLNLQTGTFDLRLKGHKGRVNAALFVDEGSTVLSASSDGDIRLWDLRYGAAQRIIQQSPDREGIANFSLSPDGRRGVFGYLSGEMALWSVETGKFLHSWQAHQDMLVGGVEFSADGQLAVSGSGDFFGQSLDSSVRVWRVATGERLHSFEGHTRHVRGVAFAPNQQFVLSAAFDSTVRYGSLSDGSQRTLLDISPHNVFAVAISPNSRWAAIGLAQQEAYLALDTDILLLDIATGETISRFAGHLGGGVMKLAFAPNGRFLLSSSFDNTVRVWEMDESIRGECRHVLTGHHGTPTQIAISPNGRFAATGGHDTELILWDLEAGEALRRWQGHKEMIMSLHFTPDGTSVISTSLDESIRMWRVDASQEILMRWIEENRPSIL